MTDARSARGLARAGILLIILALLNGLAVPAFLNPRLAIATHLSGILDGLLLIAVASVWTRLTLTRTQARVAQLLVIGGAYLNWGTLALASAWGTNRNTPMAGAGFGAAAWQELIVHAMQVTMAVALLVSLSLVFYGLRGSGAHFTGDDDARA